MKFEPTEEQKLIAAHKEGPAFVGAVAGAAKTTTAILRIKTLVESGVSPHKILLTTFSRLGAADMRKKAVQFGVRSGVECRTIHSVVWRMISDAFGKTKKLPPSWFARAVVRKSLKEFAALHCMEQAPVTTKETLSEIGLAKANLILPDAWTSQVGDPCPSYKAWAESREFEQDQIEAVDYAYRQLEAQRLDPLSFEWKLKGWEPGIEALDHDDAISITAKAILEGEGWVEPHKGRFDHVCLDEVQDQSMGQWVCVRFLAKTFEREVDGEVSKWKNVMATGDDQQCIYEWRGSASWLLEDFLNEGPQVHFFQLTTNFRSGQKILDAANGILRAAKGRLFDGELKLGRTGVEGEVHFNVYPNAHAEAQAIVSRIKASLEAGRKPSEIAVVYRINASAGLVEMALIREKIPYRVAGRAFFSRPDVVAALAYIQLVLDENNQEAYEIAYRVPLKGIGRAFLDRFPTFKDLRQASHGEIGSRWGRGSRRFKSDMEDLKEILEKQGLAAALRFVFGPVGVRGHFMADSDSADGTEEGDSEDADGEQDEAIETLVSCAEAAESPEALIEFANGDTGKEDDGGDRLWDKRVTLTTAHRDKGLEHEEVHLMGMAEGLFPLARAPRDEEWRLGYVAFTRAKDVLYVSCSPQRDGEEVEPSSLVEAAGLIAREELPVAATKVDLLPDFDMDDLPF